MTTIRILAALASAAPIPAPPAPETFASVFTVGYGTVDHLPKDEATFEKLLESAKEAGYNTIYCVYRDWRVELCRKHGIRMMIDVLAWKEDAGTDIRREGQREKVKAICERVRGDRAVWGYNLWNERADFYLGGLKGLNEDLARLREWDPTHPVWVGTYRNYFMDQIEGNPGVFGYYDYHWQRGMEWNLTLLAANSAFVASRGACLGRWLMNSDYERNSYTLNTSIAHGLKVVLWFIGGALDPKTGALDAGHHHVRIGREMRALYPELAAIGRPIAVFSTPTTRTADDREKEKGIPKPMAEFPEDHWVRVLGGEAVLGFFRYPGGDDAIYVANHNAFAGQSMVLAIRREKTAAVRMFDRLGGSWRTLERDGETVRFPLGPGGGELLRLAPARTESGTCSEPPFPYVWATAAPILPGTHNNQSGYFSLSEGLDGAIHVGTAKYGENAFLVEFNPRTGAQRIVIDAHRVLGQRATGYAAQAKIHTRNFVGPSGRVYVGTKQGYPTEQDKKDGVAYGGGYVIVYDPRTGETENLGMPYAGQGVIDVVADERRGILYVVTCEEQHWMWGDAKARAYREIGPLLTPYATTLLDGRGRANAITKEFELAQYDPESGAARIRPIQVDGRRWTRANPSSIPTWNLAADGRTAYAILMNDPTLLAIDLASEGPDVRAVSHGRMIEGENPDSRCALSIAPDGRVYAVVRIDNATGFGKGHLHHLVRFDPGAKRMEDLGVIAVKDTDFFAFGPGPDGKEPPWSHGFHRLPDGALTPLYHHMAMLVARDGTIYVTVIYPFALLKIEAFRKESAPPTPSQHYIREALDACDRVEANLPGLIRTAEIIAERHAGGGMIGFPWIRQTLGVELYGRSGGIMHVGFDRPWKEDRTDAEKARDIAILGWDRPPDAGDLDAVKREKQRGCYVVGFGPREMPELAPHAAACDAWIDAGTGADDRVVALADGSRAGRINPLANALGGWALTGEIVAALTRAGRMPVMWKSWLCPDGRAWSDPYFRKKPFHDDYRIAPIAAGELTRAYLDRIRFLLRRFEATQLAGIRAAAGHVARELDAGRKTIIASAGHMPMYYVGQYEDRAWAVHHGVDAFLASLMEGYGRDTPDGALVVRLGETGIHRDLAELMRRKKQRVILMTAENPDPDASGRGMEWLEAIDMGYAFGDACVPIPGYPIRVLPASGVLQVAAYESLDVEVLSLRGAPVTTGR